MATLQSTVDMIAKDMKKFLKSGEAETWPYSVVQFNLPIGAIRLPGLDAALKARCDAEGWKFFGVENADDPCIPPGVRIGMPKQAPKRRSLRIAQRKG